MPNLLDPLQKYLDDHKVTYHLQPYFEEYTAKEAARELGLDLNKLYKSILFKNQLNKPLLFVLPIGKKIDLKKLAFQIKQELTLAKKNEVKKYTGYDVGTVCPFLLKEKMPVYLDEEAVNHKQIGVGSGQKGYELIISPHIIINLAGAISIVLD